MPMLPGNNHSKGVHWSIAIISCHASSLYKCVCVVCECCLALSCPLDSRLVWSGLVSGVVGCVGVQNGNFREGNLSSRKPLHLFESVVSNRSLTRLDRFSAGLVYLSSCGEEGKASRWDHMLVQLCCDVLRTWVGRGSKLKPNI